MKKAPAVNKVTAIHGVITDQSPVDFHALGLAGCIDRLAEPLREQGTAVRWETPHHGIEIPAGSAGLLYHAAQEALSNALKYAGATEMTVRLAAVDHGIRLTVADNGAGFDRNDHAVSRPQGFGLLLMSIAVDDAGGYVTVESAPGQGTCVTVTLPLD
jgi:two-component system sensor histidine kinase UhpB